MTRVRLVLALVLALAGVSCALVVSKEGSGASGLDGDATSTSSPATGAVYAFRRDGAAWSQLHYVKPFNPTFFMHFGVGLALSPDALVVGAPDESTAASGVNATPSGNLGSAGAAYLYRATQRLPLRHAAASLRRGRADEALE